MNEPNGWSLVPNPGTDVYTTHTGIMVYGMTPSGKPMTWRLTVEKVEWKDGEIWIRGHDREGNMRRVPLWSVEEIPRHMAGGA